jgi:outer membrane protein insertion porin family
VQSSATVNRTWLAWFFIAACGHQRPALRCPSGNGAIDSHGDRSTVEVPSGRVSSVRVVGVAADLARTLELGLATRPGMELPAAALVDDLRMLWASGTIADARVELDGDGAVRFAVTPRARITSLVVRGGDAESARRFRLLEGGLYEPARILRMTQAAQEAYAREGRIDAVVAPSVTLARGRVDVCIQATPGPRIRIGALAFAGNRELTTSHLLAALRRGPVPSQVGASYDPIGLSEGLWYVSLAYWDAGFVDVNVGEPRVERRGDRVAIEVAVVEGPRFRFGAITTSRPVAIRLPLVAGQPFSRTLVTQAIDQLVEATRGADVVPKTTVDRERHTVAIAFEIAGEP